MASASLMCEAVKGKQRAEVEHLFNEVHAVLTHHDAPIPDDLGKKQDVIHQEKVSDKV